MGATLSNLADAAGLAEQLSETVEPGRHKRQSSIDWNKLCNVTLTDVYGQQILIPVSTALCIVHVCIALCIVHVCIALCIWYSTHVSPCQVQ